MVSRAAVANNLAANNPMANNLAASDPVACNKVRVVDPDNAKAVLDGVARDVVEVAPSEVAEYAQDIGLGGTD